MSSVRGSLGVGEVTEGVIEARLVVRVLSAREARQHARLLRTLVTTQSTTVEGREVYFYDLGKRCGVGLQDRTSQQV